jgi:hypothetical protein
VVPELAVVGVIQWAARTVTPRAVRARAVDVPVARPVETAAGVLRSAPLVLIDVETDEGVTGRSYVRTYTPLALTPLADLVENLASVITMPPQRRTRRRTRCSATSACSAHRD